VQSLRRACADALTEYFDRFTEANGQEWFTVTTIVDDPVHLAAPFVTTTDFRREPNDARFAAVPVFGAIAPVRC
jgi:hypothetical protein